MILINRLCARTVNDPGDAMKKTPVIQRICNNFAAFSQFEAGSYNLWAEQCSSIKDHATKIADSSLFRDKR